MSSSQKAAVLDPEHIGLHCEINFENTLKQRVKELLKPKNDLFPGSEPINFNSSHLELLCNEDYYVCEKSDGVRYLLLSTHTKEGPSCFLINKRNSYQYISSLMLPCRENLTTFQHESLLDGELVIDEDKVTGKKSAHFLAFDLMVYNTNLITHRSFATRLGMLQQEIIAPLDKFLNSNPEISKKQPFSIKLKKMERSYGLSVVLSNIPNLKHPSDGLIFTPVGLPYKSGVCSKLLKWKPLEKLTVDFRIQVTSKLESHGDRKRLCSTNSSWGMGFHKISFR
ncbi:hypothetical protein K502DRAFT_66631 [Neoconidiobolus thromboides FSU 785]|nr:hypothetical protein K502DRAFT_66631 [Neoconidiobolus thromboides FSU 785]